MVKNTFYLNKTTADQLGTGLFKYSLVPKERFIICNTTLCEMLNYPNKTELKKKRLGDFFANLNDRDNFFGSLRKDGQVKFFETIFKDNENKTIWVMISACKVTTPGNGEYVEGIIENVDSRKEMERNLSLEQDLLQGALDSIPDAIYFKDLENRIIKVNKFYAKGVGLKPTEIVGKTDYDFFPEDQARQMATDDQGVIETGVPIVGKIERTLLPDGTWNQVITTKIPIYDRLGETAGTMGVTRDMTAYANMERERLTMLVNTLKVLGKALEMRDPYTFSHTRCVATIAEKISGVLQWDENRMLGMRLAGELHDLGKIGIPLDILNKPGKLNNLEYGLIREHVGNCYNLIKDIKFPFPLAETIYQHHERLDGSGYPRKLPANKILPEARILAVSDVLEAMTHHRPYREALGVNAAMAELNEGVGTKYDGDIVKIVSQLLKANHNKPFWLDD
ncbi:MAG: PAS domain S-box protein [Candidatus Omnitrophica bacterium]|nr:PAS domain S-box protein [Candidatus Omnitrophota bacterium]